MPATQTFTASRNATWGPTLSYDYAGAALPLKGATIAMQLRLYPGQPYDAKLSLGNIPFDDQLLSGSAGATDERRRLTLRPMATPAQLAALPVIGEAGTDDPYSFDIRIAYADGIFELLSSGQFILSPGVTTA